MFFTDDEMKIAEDLAWKMLDGWKHSYGPVADEYAHFYFNGKMILDPWMNENGQNLPWPDHENDEVAVNPIDYYGERTIESFVVNLFLLCPECNTAITERIKANLGDNGKLITPAASMPVAVYVAMSDTQAEEEHGYECIENEIPDSLRIYLGMDKLPEDIFRVVKMGWEREVVFHKKDLKKAIKCLYPNGTTWDYKKYVDRIMGSYVRLIGFGD